MMWCEKAIKKLDAESAKKLIKGRYECAVSGAVCTALKNFAGQSEEFAQAIVQSEGSFADCLKKVVEGVGTSISDIDAYRRAVEFYFPGAVVDMALTIRMSKYDKPDTPKAEQEETRGDIALSLFDLM